MVRITIISNIDHELGQFCVDISTANVCDYTCADFQHDNSGCQIKTGILSVCQSFLGGIDISPPHN